MSNIRDSISKDKFSSIIPNKSLAFSIVISSNAVESCSSKLQASLKEPDALSAINQSISSLQFISSFSEIDFNLFTTSEFETFLKSNLWHLEIIVSGSFWYSVVASIIIT